MSRSRPLTRNQLAAFLPNHEVVKAFERLMDEAYVNTPADLTALVIALQETTTETATASAKADSALAILTNIAQSLELLALAPVDAGPYLASIAQSLELLASAPSVQLGTASPLNAPGSGNAGSKEVVLGSDTRLSDARLPTGPAFSAYVGSAQVLATSVITRVQFNTEEFDTAGCYDNVTNYRFTPTVAGYYQVSGSACIAVTLGSSALASIFKNGGEFKRGTQVTLNTTGLSVVEVTVTALIFMNGTTDYVELWAYCVGTTPTVQNSPVLSYFQASLARSS